MYIDLCTYVLIYVYTMKLTSVYMHLATHKKSPSLSDISWEVLHKDIQAFNTRKILEA